MCNHDKGGPGTALRTANLRPRTMEKGLGELAQDRRAWSASVVVVVETWRLGPLEKGFPSKR